MLLSSDHFAAFFVQHQLDALFLALLALLLVRGFILFTSRSLEDLGLHREEFIQRHAVLGMLIVFGLFGRFLGLFLRWSRFLTNQRFLHRNRRNFRGNGCDLRLRFYLSHGFNHGLRYWLSRGRLGELGCSQSFFDIRNRFWTDPRQSQHFVGIHLHRHHQRANCVDPGFHKDIEDMLFQLKLFKRHPKCRRWNFGASSCNFLFFCTSRVFLDLDGTAFHTVHELPEHGEFFGGNGAVFGFLRQHFFHGRNGFHRRR